MKFVKIVIGYILVNIHARCNEGKSMTKMKEIGCPCYDTPTSVLGSYNTKDEFDNVETHYM